HGHHFDQDRLARDGDRRAGETPMQCAWCRRLYDGDEIVEPPLDQLLPDASHGICPACHATLLEKRRETLRGTSDLSAALDVDRERLTLLLVVARRNYARLAARCVALEERTAIAVRHSREVLKAVRSRPRPLAAEDEAGDGVVGARHWPRRLETGTGPPPRPWPTKRPATPPGGRASRRSSRWSGLPAAQSTILRRLRHRAGQLGRGTLGTTSGSADANRRESCPSSASSPRGSSGRRPIDTWSRPEIPSTSPDR